MERAIRANGRRRCVIVTVLWGDWHRQMFLDVNLPTLLAPGNLPTLAAGLDCEYLVYTTRQDADLMMRSRAFDRLRSLMGVSFKLFEPSKTQHPIALQTDIWLAATGYARRRGAFMLFMPPDVAWADGSFAQLRAALEGGKRAIFMTYPRVTSETIVSALIERFPRNSDDAIIIPPNDMMALTIAHIHPLMGAHARSAMHFSVHPEMVLWPIEGDGFLLRLLARELFCFEPGGYPLNQNSLLARMPPTDEIHVFADSREFLGISFTPFWKDMEWYLRRRPLDPLFVGRWWTNYDSPVNDYISAVDFRFTCGRGSEPQWSRASRQAANLLAHLRSAREFLRILITLQEMGLLRAAEFLASALRVHGLARRWPHRGPFLVFAPTDDVVIGYHRLLGGEPSPVQARKIIEAHVAVMPKPNFIKDGLEVVTLGGTRLRLEGTRRLRHCGHHCVLPWSGPLHTIEQETGSASEVVPQPA
jgi:hypothetical protein